MVVRKIDYGNAIGNMLLIENPEPDILQLISLMKPVHKRIIKKGDAILYAIGAQEICANGKCLMTTKGERNPFYTFLLQRVS